MGQIKKRNSLSLKLVFIFALFSLVSAAFGGLASYRAKTSERENERQKTLFQTAKYLEDLILADGVNFAYVEDFAAENQAEIEIRADFTDSHADRRAFEQLFQNRHSGKILGVNIKFLELDFEVKKAFAIHKIEYFLDLFEKAQKDFGVTRATFLVPQGKGGKVFRLIDSNRAENLSSDKKNIVLGNEISVPTDRRVFWQSWESGRKSDELDFYDADGKTVFAASVPLVVNGRKLGVICTEIAEDGENRSIPLETLFLALKIEAVLAVLIVLFVVFLSKKYITKISSLEADVLSYAMEKNVQTAKIIEDKTRGKNEISSLSRSVAEMIRELENYMNTLSAANAHAAEKLEFATRDALTGIRNKTAFEGELQKIEWKVAAGYTDFGIALIDLNFLKKINDNFGHEKGNIAIKKLCYIVCHQFEHSPVFKIGGDEFAVILEDSDFQNIKRLSDEFNAQIASISSDESLEEWERISASIGFALMDDMQDESAADVLKRAEKALLSRKKSAKSR